MVCASDAEPVWYSVTGFECVAVIAVTAETVNPFQKLTQALLRAVVPPRSSVKQVDDAAAAAGCEGDGGGGEGDGGGGEGGGGDGGGGEGGGGDGGGDGGGGLGGGGDGMQSEMMLAAHVPLS